MSFLALLRTASPRDTPGILELVADVWSEYELVLDTGNDEPHLLRAGEPDNHFRASGGEFWVVEENGGIVGTVAVKLSGDSGELKSLYIHRSLRRRGWGARLTELAAAHIREAGKRKIVLWSDTRFLDAHRLYRRLGFTECGTRELHDAHESVEYGFEKPL